MQTASGRKRYSQLVSLTLFNDNFSLETFTLFFRCDLLYSLAASLTHSRFNDSSTLENSSTHFLCCSLLISTIVHYSSLLLDSVFFRCDFVETTQEQRKKAEEEAKKKRVQTSSPSSLQPLSTSVKTRLVRHVLTRRVWSLSAHFFQESLQGSRSASPGMSLLCFAS